MVDRTPHADVRTDMSCLLYSAAHTHVQKQLVPLRYAAWLWHLLAGGQEDQSSINRTCNDAFCSSHPYDRFDKREKVRKKAASI
jgi:hypothetical protein